MGKFDKFGLAVLAMGLASYATLIFDFIRS